MTYPILWILSVYIWYKTEVPCDTTDLYYYRDEQECRADLEFIHSMQILNENERFAQLSCTMR